jgi:hypothetical protein
VEWLHDGLEHEKKWKAQIRVCMEFAWWGAYPRTQTISLIEFLAHNGTAKQHRFSLVRSSLAALSILYGMAYANRSPTRCDDK